MTLRAAYRQQLEAQKQNLARKQREALYQIDKRRIQFEIDHYTRRIEALK